MATQNFTINIERLRDFGANGTWAKCLDVEEIPVADRQKIINNLSGLHLESVAQVSVALFACCNDTVVTFTRIIYCLESV